MSDLPPGRWVYLKEAAAHFDRSEKTIRRRIEQGLLEAKKEHGRLLVFVDTIDHPKSDIDPTVSALRTELDNVRKQNEQLSELLSDLRQDRDRWASQAAALTALLGETRQQLEATTEKKWWQFWK